MLESQTDFVSARVETIARLIIETADIFTLVLQANEANLDRVLEEGVSLRDDQLRRVLKLVDEAILRQYPRYLPLQVPLSRDMVHASKPTIDSHDVEGTIEALILALQAIPFEHFPDYHESESSWRSIRERIERLERVSNRSDDERSLKVDQIPKAS